ncbi:Glycosyl transferase family 2 [Ectothiorhodosinus mongolicus]|uniref:Glycosyl transferase family 2 n=1 Tax=Ectothiorhodosinus mongolicus TaxID=233100 RepID=A0A1R3VU21_9GAMM|nr:glycosyltransferase family 2 protein [Ectothiorhodosinus mongolicus]ULX56776.1 glycosyltransferase [Ectothiorhodosinus mongolicus]SIT67235.1 Glycosyl transferase family 2 [Ectothiorhodosinus mongolicus]
MTDWIELDPAYSTTRLVRKVAPEVVESELKAAHKPEDQFETIIFQPEGEGCRAVGGLRTKGYFKKSSEEKPLITVITVVFNGEQYLEETILSVIKQAYDNVEYIIIDGGSSDGTLDIIRKYEHAIDYWLSESDDGIYYAMNKGIRLALGDIIGLVNADDVIYLHTVENIAEALLAEHNAGFTMAPVELAYLDGKVFGIVKPLANYEIYERMWNEMPSPHQGVYVRINIYKNLGLFNEKYALSADYDYLLRLLLAHIKYACMDQPVGFFRSGGLSGGLQTWLETRELLSAYGRPRLEIEYGFISSIAKMIAARTLPDFLFKKLKKFNKKSKRNLY